MSKAETPQCSAHTTINPGPPRLRSSQLVFSLTHEKIEANRIPQNRAIFTIIIHDYYWEAKHRSEKCSSPIYMRVVCYRLLERLELQRISPPVDIILSPDIAVYRITRCTPGHVSALTTSDENGCQRNMKTVAVFPEFKKAYNAVRHKSICPARHFGSSNSHRPKCNYATDVLGSNLKRHHGLETQEKWPTAGLERFSTYTPRPTNNYIPEVDLCIWHRHGYMHTHSPSSRAASQWIGMAQMAPYCHLWRLKPIVPYIVSSVFHFLPMLTDNSITHGDAERSSS